MGSRAACTCSNVNLLETLTSILAGLNVKISSLLMVVFIFGYMLIVPPLGNFRLLKQGAVEEVEGESRFAS